MRSKHCVYKHDIFFSASLDNFPVVCDRFLLPVRNRIELADISVNICVKLVDKLQKNGIVGRRIQSHMELEVKILQLMLIALHHGLIDYGLRLVKRFGRYMAALIAPNSSIIRVSIMFAISSFESFVTTAPLLG